MAQPSTTQVTPRRRRRGVLGYVFNGSMGCLAFFVGAIIAAALFAPSMLAGPLRDAFFQDWNKTIAGEMSLGQLQLSWTHPQRLDSLRPVSYTHLTLPTTPYV